MNTKSTEIHTHINSLYDFRSKIPAYLSKKKINDVWDITVKEDKYKDISTRTQKIIKTKLKIVKRNLDWIVFKPLVRFVGISGSIASEFVRNKDDIDFFIVVKNDTAWIYRLYLYAMNVFKRWIRSRERQNVVKDKFCMNYIVEERALGLEADLFNLNELLYLKPIYNEGYLSVIFLVNTWVKDIYQISEKFLKRDILTLGMLKPLTRRNFLFFLLNIFCFVGQLTFMTIMGHKPDIKRLWYGFRLGEIEFFPKDFKSKVYSN